MKLKLRRWSVVVDERKISDESTTADPPLRKVAVVAVVENPYAGSTAVDDLSGLIEQSADLGSFMSDRAIEAMHPYAALSYGKGCIVGLSGAQEHINALVTTAFAEPLRTAIGGGRAWI